MLLARTGTGRGLFRLIALSRRSPTKRSDLAAQFRGRFDLMRHCPLQFFFLGITTAVMPALVGVLTAAGMILARVRSAFVLDNLGRQWKPYGA
jgi:hypothetical protein